MAVVCSQSRVMLLSVAKVKYGSSCSQGRAELLFVSEVEHYCSSWPRGSRAVVLAKEILCCTVANCGCPTVVVIICSCSQGSVGL